MTAVVFDVAAFKVRYPAFAAAGDDLLTAFFNEATLYLSNGDCSPVPNVTRRAMLLNMIAAHIASLNGAASGGNGAAAPVGRIGSATEGSVSISYSFESPGAAAAWYNQTQYGAAFWQATSSLRGFRYVPQPTRWR